MNAGRNEKFLAIAAAVVAISGPILAVLGVIIMGIGKLITSGWCYWGRIYCRGRILQDILHQLGKPLPAQSEQWWRIAALVGILIYGWQTSETFRNAVTSAVTQIWESPQAIHGSHGIHCPDTSGSYDDHHRWSLIW